MKRYIGALPTEPLSKNGGFSKKKLIFFLYNYCQTPNMEILPYEIKRFEILARLDSVSAMVLRNVLLNKPFGKISASEQRVVVSYGLDYTKYFYELGLLNSSRLSKDAAEHGHLAILKWCRKNKFYWDASTCSMAAANGHLHIIQWARDNGCDWNADTCTFAAGGGHIKTLIWCRTNGCDWDVYTCAYAAGSGHLELLQWCHDNKCPWDADTCTFAAANGHLELLQWARTKGCSWDAWTLACAAAKGHLETLKWCRDNGCPQ